VTRDVADHGLKGQARTSYFASGKLKNAQSEFAKSLSVIFLFIKNVWKH
jgi:hypothetical protein